jgi:pilus assembly protein CpaC
MSFNRSNSPSSGKLPRLGAAALALGTSLATMSALAIGFSSASSATDLDVTQSTSATEDGNFLRIGLGKSAVIKLPSAVKDVVVGDQSVVEVVIRNQTTAYLFARHAKQTNVFFFDAEGREILHLDLEVTLDTKGPKKLIDRAIPGNNIQVDSTGDSIVLKPMSSMR